MPRALRALARARLDRGELPRERPSLVVAGVPMIGQRCALCDEVITGHVEIRTTFPALRVLHFHGLCHWAWDVERSA